MRKLFIIILIVSMAAVVSAQWPYDNKPMLGEQLDRTHPLGRPVGFWPMQGGSANQVYDLSGNGNVGTFGAGAASPIWVPGKSGSSIEFDGGSSQYITMGDVALYDFTTEPFSVVIRFKTGPRDIGDHERLISKGETGVDYGWNLGFYSVGDFIMWGDSAGFIYSTIAYDDGLWHDLVAVYDGGVGGFTTLHIYIDGIEQAVDTLGAFAGFTATSQPLIIGAHSDDGAIVKPYTGGIEFANIYNRALSASEVALLYREPFCMFEVEDVALMAEGVPAAPTGGQVIMITILPMIFVAVYLRKRKISSFTS